MLRFNVPGTPKPQGSKKGFVVNGRAVLVEAAGQDLKDWRRAVTSAARTYAANHLWELTNAPLEVDLLFSLLSPQRPKFKAFPAVKPDIDKLTRAVLDGITDAKTVWLDDSQVVVLHARKVYGLPGVAVVVSAPQ